MTKRRDKDGDKSLVLFDFEPIQVPLLAFVGAGRHPDSDTVESPMSLRWIRPVRSARKHDNFGYVRVAGDSLSGDGIEDGDVLIIRTNFDTYELTPGRLVVVDCPFGLMAKRIYVGLNGHVRLVASDPRFSDIELEAEQVKVLGIITRRERDY